MCLLVNISQGHPSQTSLIKALFLGRHLLKKSPVFHTGTEALLRGGIPGPPSSRHLGISPEAELVSSIPCKHLSSPPRRHLSPASSGHLTLPPARFLSSVLRRPPKNKP
ncbi:UNVERIFIED_CONTAM: hypothetical protein Slati_2770900 [Sesamum latifolium]|uniref:Uncharacterized protein n=1 Tax=Sesamum latifolium TaxID=2727402 RepID=A0AAW2W2G8_9LAMI